MGPDNDLPLVKAMGGQRNREAFAELFQRHQRAAQSVATMITGHQDEAEEAVQEAMLRVWQASSSFQPQEGATVRSWLLRVVARESLRILRKRRREREKVPMERGVLQMQAIVEESKGAMETGEMLVKLREALTNLPEADRHIVVLAYGASMTHHEIAEALKIPRSTISNHLKKTLSALRSTLTEAGCASALPLVSADGLCEAICSSVEAPPGLRERVLESLTHTDRESLRASRRAAVTGSWGQALPWPAGLVLATATAVTLWWVAGSKPTAPFAPDQAPAMPPKIVPLTPASAAPKAKPFVQVWDFNRPDSLKDIALTAGSWHWVANGGPDGSGCMESDENRLKANLEIPLVKQPLRITFRARAVAPFSKDGAMATVGWSHAHSFAVFSNAGTPLTQDLGDTKWMSICVFLTNKYGDDWANSRRLSLLAYDRAEGDRLVLTFRGRQCIDDLKIEEIRPEELPDVQPYLDALAKIEPAQRVGTVVLSELKSPQPGEQVEVTFFTAGGNFKE